MIDFGNTYDVASALYALALDDELRIDTRSHLEIGSNYTRMSADFFIGGDGMRPRTKFDMFELLAREVLAVDMWHERLRAGQLKYTLEKAREWAHGLDDDQVAERMVHWWARMAKP